MKYLKHFNLESEYDLFKNGTEYMLPNVSYAKDTNKVFFGPKIEITIPSNDPVFDADGNFVPWAKIQHINGKLYTPQEWEDSVNNGSIDSADVNGIAVRYSTLCACPAVFDFRYWQIGNFGSSMVYDNEEINNLISENITVLENPYLDIDFKKNTQVYSQIIEANLLGEYFSNEMKQYLNITSVNGSPLYFGSLGVVRAFIDNYSVIISCADTISCTYYKQYNNYDNPISEYSGNCSELDPIGLTFVKGYRNNYILKGYCFVEMGSGDEINAFEDFYLDCYPMGYSSLGGLTLVSEFTYNPQNEIL